MAINISARNKDGCDGAINAYSAIHLGTPVTEPATQRSTVTSNHNGYSAIHLGTPLTKRHRISSRLHRSVTSCIADNAQEGRGVGQAYCDAAIAHREANASPAAVHTDSSCDGAINAYAAIHLGTPAAEPATEKAIVTSNHDWYSAIHLGTPLTHHPKRLVAQAANASLDTEVMLPAAVHKDSSCDGAINAYAAIHLGTPAAEPATEKASVTSNNYWYSAIHLGTPLTSKL